MSSGSSMFQKISNVAVVRAIRSGLVKIIPVLMAGSFALILRSFPVAAYQSFIADFANGLFYNLFSLMYNATFGLLSVYMSASVGIEMSRELSPRHREAYGVQFASMAAFLVSAGFLTSSFKTNSLSAVGMFTAIICGISASYIYTKISARFEHLIIFSDGADSSFNNVIRAIPSLFIICLGFALVNSLIASLSDFGCLWAFMEHGFASVFNNIGENFAGSFIYVLASSVLWFFGVHGSDVLETVNQNLFTPAINANIDAVAAGNMPTELFTKTFLDVFVLMGGCGTTLSLLIAIFLFSKRKSNLSLAKMAAFPMLFNINELMVFGLPIIYNPILFVPFICAPVASLLISTAALSLGIVPYTIASVEWTTPIILGGFQATGSVAGSILQLVCLAAGVLIYMPFVRMYDREKEKEALDNIDNLVSILKKCEESRTDVVLTELYGIPGEISKQLINDLRKAMDDGTLQMYYQPQFHLNGSVVGAEALLRWKHPVFGMIYPPLVIKLADEANLLTELEKQTFLLVKKDVENIDMKMTVSVNSTPQSFRNAGFIDFLKETFPDALAGKVKICIEITEQSEFVTGSAVIDTLEGLRAHGFRLAIDDFSMGFTSLKYLSDNKFDTVKLDGSLVRGLQNSRNLNIIKSIVYLSQSLGFSVLAEYVETESQRDALAEIGCLEYQGYLYSTALPAEEFFTFIQ